MADSADYLDVPIPRSRARGIEQLLPLSPDQQTSIFEKLALLSPRGNFLALTDELHAATGLEKPTLFSILQMLAGLATDIRASQQDSDRFVKALFSALVESDEFEATSAERDVLVPLLSKALAPDSVLSLSAKAYDLLYNHERTYCEGHIITDFRPVFAEPMGESIKRGVIVHELQVGFHEDGGLRHRSISIAVDEDDLKDLRSLIDRALNKQALLRKSMTNAGYDVLGV